MPKQDIEDIELKSILDNEYIALYGVADLGRLRQNFTCPYEPGNKYPVAIVFACRLSDELINTLVDKSTNTYAYHYRQVNAHLDRVALKIASYIQSIGKKAFPVPSSQIIDWKENTGHLSHRLLAWDAGLGWFGRSRLIVTPEYGARVRFASVLTDLQLSAGKPIEMTCENCKKCVSMCPAGAIGESFSLDKCQEKLSYFKRYENIGQYICGICVKACTGRLNRLLS